MAIDIPGYKVRKTIGKGGMATVYLAEQEIFERDVALKIMSRALGDDPSFGQRFFREAKIVSQLEHPNIVTVYDVGVHNKTYYLSMEYIDGGDLKSLRRSLSLSRKVEAIRDIAKALEYAGVKGYVHRDIKPENIMFHTVDNRAVLMDFGIARAAETDASMTQTGTAIGTPHYMSPEQAKGKPVDPRSDLYSLGVVFYLLISGSVPYDAESAVAIGIKHITEPIPKLPRGYEALQPLINKMMAKNAEERFQTAKELVAELSLINIPRIERKVRGVQESEQREMDDSDVDATTMVTPVVDPSRSIIRRATEDAYGNDEGADIEVDEIKPALVPFEDEDYDNYGKFSNWSAWVAGVLVFACVAVFVLYQQKPEIVRPWVDKSAIVIEGARSTFEKLSGRIKEILKTESQKSKSPSPVVSEAQKKTKESVSEEIASEKTNKLSTLKKVPKNDAETASNALEAENSRLKTSELKARGDSPAILALREKLDALSNGFFGEREKLPDLVDAHRALLANLPEDKKTLDSLSALIAGEKKRIAADVELGEINSANKRLLQLKYLFPEVTAKQYSVLEQQIAQKEKVITWLSEAEVLLAKNALTKPETNSALTRYKQVLAVEPNNKTAKKGIIQVANKLAQLADVRFESGKIKVATSFINKALAIDSLNPYAKKVQAKIHARENAKRLRLEQLENGRRKLFSGDLFEPETNSAFYYYSQVLKKNPNDKAALQGVDNVVEALSSRVWKLVGEERFEQAKAELVRPRRLMGNTKRLQSLSKAVDEVIVEKKSQ